MFNDRFQPVTFACLPQIAELAGATELEPFWDVFVKVLRRVAPHHAAVVWCNYSAKLHSDSGGGALSTIRENPQQRCYALTGQHLHHYAGKELPRVAATVTLADLKISNEDYYRNHIQPLGWEHAATLCFWSGKSLKADVALYRTRDEGAFTDDEVQALRDLHPVAEAALVRLLNDQRHKAMHINVIEFLRSLPVGLVLLDWQLQPAFVNEEGYRQTLVWNHAPAPPRRLNPVEAFKVPDDLRQLCENFRGQWFQALFNGQPLVQSFSEMTRHPSHPGLKATISVSHLREGSSQPPDFLIRYSGMSTRVDQTFQPSRAQLSVFAQLTPTERSVTMLVMRGLSNQEIARQLHREISTVKDHLSHIYDKLGIRSRTQLASLLTH